MDLKSKYWFLTRCLHNQWPRPEGEQHQMMTDESWLLELREVTNQLMEVIQTLHEDLSELHAERRSETLATARYWSLWADWTIKQYNYIT